MHQRRRRALATPAELSARLAHGHGALIEEPISSDVRPAIADADRVRTVAWRGLDDPQRLDVVRFVFSPEAELRANGGSVAAAYALTWSLVTRRHWVTSSMWVEVRGDGWSRSLLLARDGAGRWQATTAARGGADLPEPGLDDPDALDDALDCDLALCPATNVMPILRLGLTGERPRRRELATALVEVPALRVVRSEQAYELVERRADERFVVRFSAKPDFQTQLDVDPDGLVVRYPDLAVAVAGVEPA